ncbi:hypothetical protein CAPTEDRAFT_199845 [Capitella teleta]|uniref:RRM domain-containing protein n=1 Tax=Capitella teleta TaxID=283909 RepID=R7VB42_CAPTE|nr:hypothetical protein CAPTEDRAFT_199845 [Capitella teleta]|eukprot:ELU16053.1 hypothetical protein CAPTEDRAFT_199845 [Capitella teleta]
MDVLEIMLESPDKGILVYEYKLHERNKDELKEHLLSELEKHGVITVILDGKYLKAYAQFKTIEGAKLALKQKIEFRGAELKCTFVDPESFVPTSEETYSKNCCWLLAYFQGASVKPKERPESTLNSSEHGPLKDSIFSSVVATVAPNTKEIERIIMGFQKNVRITRDERNGLLVKGSLEDICRIEQRMKENVIETATEIFPNEFWVYVQKCRGLLLKNIQEANRVELKTEREGPSTVVTASAVDHFASPLDALQAIKEMHKAMKSELKREEVYTDFPLRKVRQYLKEIQGMYFNVVVELSRDKTYIGLYGPCKIVDQAKQDLVDLLHKMVDISKTNYHQSNSGLDGSTDYQGTHAIMRGTRGRDYENGRVREGGQSVIRTHSSQEHHHRDERFREDADFPREKRPQSGLSDTSRKSNVRKDWDKELNNETHKESHKISYAAAAAKSATHNA